jgi:hypothetical protein
VDLFIAAFHSMEPRGIGHLDGLRFVALPKGQRRSASVLKNAPVRHWRLESVEKLGVESTWSSCLPLGKTVISWGYSASQGALSGMWTKPFWIIAVWLWVGCRAIASPAKKSGDRSGQDHTMQLDRRYEQCSDDLSVVELQLWQFGQS